MVYAARSRCTNRVGLLCVALVSAVTWAGSINANAQLRPLPDHVPDLVASSQAIGEVSPKVTIPLALVLPLRNPAGLEDLLQRLYDPFDPLYCRYLTPLEFTDLFGPTQQDYNAVADWAHGEGYRVAGHPNRLLLDVTADAATIERTLALRLMRYRAPDGRLFVAPDRNPVFPSDIAARILGVVGLDTASVRRNRIARRKEPLIHPMLPGGNGFGAPDIATAYDLNNLLLKDGKTAIDGSGQVLAVFELTGYAPGDIKAYEKQFFPSRVTSGKLPKLTNVPVDGFTGAGDPYGEATLDIELQVALAPGASKVMVYESPGNTNAQWLDCYNKMATDNLAKSISTSWGLGPAETSPGKAYVYAENVIFEEMAAQGQSMYDAAGDWGCYSTDFAHIALDDPTSPYMVTVGGTSLTTTATGAWKSETTWNDFARYGEDGGASGGGISAVFGIPSYQAQAGVITAASKASLIARNMPDVSLDSDPNTGYAIYYQGGWYEFGGTSCAAPLWAAFNALVNQKRAADNVAPLNAPLGFPLPAIYAVALSSHYAADFHDIADGSTNGNKSILHFAGYPATAGFDDATGWGTFVGAKLLADLASDPSGIVTQLLGDPGFEDGSSLPAPWTPTGKIISNSSSEPAHSGSWKVWFGGSTKKQTSTLKQTVQLPAGLTAATLSFWLHVDTAETGTKAIDTLTVAFTNKAGKVIATLAAYSNLNANSGYTQETFDLTKTFSVSTYADQPITLILTGAQKGTLQTSFVVDDFALNVTP